MSRAKIRIGALERLAGYHLRQASGAFAADFTVAMDGTGLRQAAFAVLSIVAANPGINQGAVCRTLGMKPGNMVALINELTDKELVDRVINARDRRAFTLRITAHGEKAMRDAIARIQAHEDRMLAGFSEGDKSLLLSLLERVERQRIPSQADRADLD